MVPRMQDNAAMLHGVPCPGQTGCHRTGSCGGGADAGLIMQGLAWVNGFNLGWYWPAAGPQMTTYVPGPLLRAGGNDVVLLEFLCAPSDEAGTHVHNAAITQVT